MGPRTNTRSVWATAVLFCALTATSPVAAESLERALISAYQNNPTLLAARAELRAVDESVPQALSNYRPDVSMSVEIGKQSSRTKSGFFTAKENRTPRTLNWVEVDQPLFRGFRTLAETREAEHRVRAQRALLMSTEQDVLEAAATAYMDVVRDQAVLDLNINNVQVLERQLQATRDRFSVGEVTRTDVAQAEARLSRARADRVTAEGDLEASRARYENVVGARPGNLVQPPGLSELPATFEEALSLATAQNPNVISAKFIERAARDGVDIVAGELLPTISLNARVARNRETNVSDGLSDTEIVTTRIRVPFYQSGSVTSRLREAKQVVGQRRMQISVARRDAVEDATRAWEDLQTSRAEIRAFTTEANANSIALEGVEEEAAAGLRTVLDVLDAEQELLDARVNLVRAQRDEVVAGFRLLTAVGRLTAQDLGLPVEIYDPNRYYERVRLKLWGLGDGLPNVKK